MKKIIYLSLVFLFSCIRAEKNETTAITLNLPASIKQDVVDAKKFNPNGTIAPSSLSEINCYVVLVAGPEDYLRRNTCQKNSGTYFNVGFYRGGFYSGSSGNKISLEIPSGKDRVLRLVGFKVDLTGASTLSASDAQKVCETFTANSSYEQYMSDPYLLSELGQLELIGGQNKEVDMTATLVATETIKNCQGPDFNQNSSGPPTKLLVEFQDGIGTATSQLRSTSCAAVKFRITDDNGNYPNLTSNPIISADIIVDQSGQPVGDFYNPPSSEIDPCAAANVITPVSGKINLSFNNAGQTFADRVLFFKPNVSAASRLIEFKKNTYDLVDYTLNFNYNSTTPVQSLAKYHLLDLFNNTSSAKATIALKRNYVRKNECRMAVLQFIDPAGVPISVNAPSTPDNIKVEETTIGNITYYASKSDCDSNVSGVTSVKAVSFTPSIASSGFAFYYKVNATFTSDFSFVLSNQLSGTPMISTGNLPAANNFWGIQSN